MSTRDGLWGFKTSKTIRLMSLTEDVPRGAASMGPSDNNVCGVGSSCSRDLGPRTADDHRVFRLGHDPSLDVEEGGIGHHRARSYEGVEEGRGPRLKPIRPAFGERQGLELPRQESEEITEFLLLDGFLPQHAVDVPGPGPVDLSRARGGERFDRDRLSLFQYIVAMADVRHALARVEHIPLDRVPGQVPDRAVSMGLDRSLNPFPDRGRRHARVDRLDRGLKRKFGGPYEGSPVASADLDGDGRVCDPAVQMGSQIELHDVSPSEPKGVVMGRRVMGRDFVNRDAGGERGSQSSPCHEVLDLLRDLSQETSLPDKFDGTFARFTGHCAGAQERPAYVLIQAVTLPSEACPGGGSSGATLRGRRRSTRPAGASTRRRYRDPPGRRVLPAPPHTSRERVGRGGSRSSR